MSYTILKKLAPIEDIVRDIPLSDSLAQQILRDRQEIKAILSGKDHRLLMMIGPCSAWPSEAVLEYAKKLRTLEASVCDQLKIVMRVYNQKPRTVRGWLGPFNQPHPMEPPDMDAGMRYVRRMMIDVLSLGLPIADEALFPQQAKGFIDLLSWVAIGARSSENQEHRVYASSLDCAVGLKNPTHGAMDIAINSIIAAQHPHVAAIDGHEVQTHGNPYAHLVLRGGNKAPNYTLPFLEHADRLMIHHGIQNPAILVDASHDNCLFEGKKDPLRQPHVIHDTLDLITRLPAIKPLIKGFMVESFILPGRQTVDPLHPERLDLNGLSITDPCLGWNETATLLSDIAQRLRTEALRKQA